jgi:hypothetical protein
MWPLRGYPQMTSYWFWVFLTPSPFGYAWPCPIQTLTTSLPPKWRHALDHFVAIFTEKFKKKISKNTITSCFALTLPSTPQEHDVICGQPLNQLLYNKIKTVVIKGSAPFFHYFDFFEFLFQFVNEIKRTNCRVTVFFLMNMEWNLINSFSDCDLTSDY